jgi:hypothetical protein
VRNGAVKYLCWKGPSAEQVRAAMDRMDGIDK